MAIKFMKKAVPHTRTGRNDALRTICLIHSLPSSEKEKVFIGFFYIKISFKIGLPPFREYKLPPKYPLIGDVAAYTKIVVLNSEPRL